jgi:hypothetical protein
VVKCACPECGHVTEMGGFDRVIAFVCDDAGGRGCAAVRRARGMRDGVEHALVTDAGSLMKAVYAGVQAWARMSWWRPEVQSGGETGG